MKLSLRSIRGVRPEVASRLASAGVRNLKDLVALGRDDDHRRHIVEQTGLAPATLRRFVGMAEVLSLDGVTPRHADALFDAGIDSFEKLRTERQERLVLVLQPVDPLPNEMLTRWVTEGPRG